MNITAITFYIFLVLTMSVRSGDALAQEPLIVIRDYGDTRPSGIPDMEELRRRAALMRVPMREITEFSPYTFPVISKKLVLGNLAAPIQHGRAGVIPFFIIGADTHSRDWLARNKPFLLDNQILRGLVTNVPDAQTFKTVVDAADPLHLHPMNIDEVGNIFGVGIYPLVITEKEILQ
jgi:integrating conjugative element protein (TIGR03765 family)